MKFIVLGILVFLRASNAFAIDGIGEIHKRTIDQIVSDASGGLKNNLMRCISQWGFYPQKKAAFSALVSKLPETSTVMLIEIGNVGFSRYDFLIIDTMAVSSSFNKFPFKLSKRLKGEVSNLLAISDSKISDPGSPHELDGNCYFVTLNRGGEHRGLAIYGTPDSARLRGVIKELLQLSHRKQERGNRAPAAEGQ